MTRRPDDRRAGGDAHVAPQHDRRFDVRGGVDARAFAGPHAGLDLGAGEADPDFAGDGVVVRFLVLLEVADVGPVRVDHVAAELRAVAQHVGEEILREIVHLAALHAVEDPGLEHVDAGVDRVGEHLAPRRLLEEPHDAPVLVGHDDAELERVGDALQRDRDVVPLLLVVPHDRAQVEVGQRIAADHQERLAGEQVVRHLHRARGAERRVLDDVVHRHAVRAAVAEVRLDLVGEIVQRRDDLVEAVPLQQLDDQLHHRLAGNGRERFGSARGQRTKPGALAPSH